jgi:hypothetical protein
MEFLPDCTAVAKSLPVRDVPSPIAAAPLDALRMTVITLTALGYREVHDLSREGKRFTTLLRADCSAISLNWNCM